MRGWLSLVLPTIIVLQTVASDPARAATKVSFGQVSATATMWPGVVATKKGFFAANGVEMDTVSIAIRCACFSLFVQLRIAAIRQTPRVVDDPQVRQDRHL